MSNKPTYKELEQRIKELEKKMVVFKRAEEKLAMFQKFAEASGQGLGWANIEGDIVYFNPALCRITGEKGLDDVIGKSLMKYYDEETQKRIADEIFPTVTREGEWVGELDIHSVKGEVVHTLNGVFAIRNEEGVPIFYCNVISDISEKKRTEEALLESERRLREAQRIARLGHWELDLISDKLIWSDEIYRIYDIDPKEFGASYEFFLDTVHPNDRKFVDKTYKDSVKNKTDYDIVHRLLLKNGTVKYVNEKCQTEYDNKGNPLRSLGSVLDITDRKQAEKELDKHRQHLEELVKERTAELTKANKKLRKEIVERKQVQEALRKEKNTAQTYLDIVGVMLVAINADQTVSLINKKGCEILGYKENEIVGKNWFDNFIPEKLREHIKNVFDKLMTGTLESIEYYENPVLTKSGQERIVAWHNTLLRDDTGKITGTLSSGEDITERKRAEEALQESEGKFRLLSERSMIGIIIVQDDVVKYVNQASSNISEYSIEELLNWKPKEFARIFHPADRSFSIEQAQKKQAGEKDIVVNYRMRLITKSGKLKWIELYSKSVIFSGKTADFITIIDITERKQAEEALQESEARQGLILRSLPMAFYIAQPFGDYGGTWVSEQIDQISGFTAEQFSEDIQLWGSRLHPEDRERVLEEFRTLPDKGEITVEYRWQAANGNYLWFLDQGVLIRDEKGQPKDIVGTWLNITERKQAEETLRKALIEVERLTNRLQAENIYLQDEIKVEHNFEEIISHNKEFKKILNKVEQVASTDATVLILGETGTGKELIARAIHNISERKNRPLVKVNCAAIPTNLIESELFGHEKGAFTGALARKIGRFELADGGTIFLDEIGDLPLELQVKLLRVLQDEEFERLGSSHTIKVDVRIIAATNRDLEGAVKAEDFRRDLYYRLNVFPIEISPLRDRKDDIPLLVNHFVKKYSKKVGKKIDSIPIKLMNSLQAYHWPGNVRELENVLERAVILSRGSTLQLDELFDYHSEIMQRGGNSLSLKENERSLILKALEESNWIIKGKDGAAARLDIPPSTLRDRIKTYGIKKPL